MQTLFNKNGLQVLDSKTKIAGVALVLLGVGLFFNVEVLLENKEIITMVLGGLGFVGLRDALPGKK